MQNTDERPQASASLSLRKLLPPKRWMPGLGLSAALITLALSGYFLRPLITGVQSSAPKPVPLRPVVKAVTALGRLEPQGEVIQLAASTQGGRLQQLLVKVGDQVQKGQVIAVLDTHDRLQAALNQAKRRVTVAQTRLAQVEAGAKTGEINAQRATIARISVQQREDVAAKSAIVRRLEAEVRNAQLEYQRYESLYQQGAVSASLRDNKKLAYEVTLQQLNEAKTNRNQAAETLAKQVQEAEATLDRITEVRPVDIEAAKAEVRSAEVAVQQAQAELDLASIKAPRRGQILKVQTWEGESIDSQKGIVALGQTDQMYTVAEVYETDLSRIRLGQLATITRNTGGSLTQPLHGVVDEVGLEVAKKDVLNTDPAADLDARVVEVKIRLNPLDSQKVKGLTNMKVKVAINL